LLKGVPDFLFFFDFHRTHFSERKGMCSDVKRTEVVLLRHRQAFCGANGRTQTAKATFAHIDVELSGVDSLGSSIGCPADFFGRPDGFDRNAIDRANLSAFVANNAIVDLIVKLIAAGIGNRNGDMGVLDGRNTLLVEEVEGVCDGGLLSSLSAFEDVRKGNG